MAICFGLVISPQCGNGVPGSLGDLTVAAVNILARRKLPRTHVRHSEVVADNNIAEVV